jgi:hypothetical protein
MLTSLVAISSSKEMVWQWTVFEGDGTAIDQSDAVRRGRLAADQGDTIGQDDYGRVLDIGEGIHVDESQHLHYDAPLRSRCCDRSGGT